MIAPLDQAIFRLKHSRRSIQRKGDFAIKTAHGLPHAPLLSPCRHGRHAPVRISLFHRLVKRQCQELGIVVGQ
jgi:hypothetical protein